MEETIDKRGWWARTFGREDEEQEDAAAICDGAADFDIERHYSYHVAVRRGVHSFDEAHEAAKSFKRGEQQILDLADTQPGLRRHIIDFLSGASFYAEGKWEEVGEHVYLLAPPGAYVKVEPTRSVDAHLYANDSDF